MLRLPAVSATSTFRGYGAIDDVVRRMTPLAKWLLLHGGDRKVITLRRRDLDLLLRWQQAASLHDIHINNGVAYWRGVELRSDHSAPGNKKRVTP